MQLYFSLRRQVVLFASLVSLVIFIAQTIAQPVYNQNSTITNATSNEDLLGHWTSTNAEGIVFDQSFFHLNGIFHKLSDQNEVSDSFINLGKSSHITFDIKQGPHLSGSFTFSTWFRSTSKLEAANSKRSNVLAVWEGINHAGWEIGMNESSRLYLRFWDRPIEASTLAKLNAPETLTIGNKHDKYAFNLYDQCWHYLAATYDISTNTANTYIDNQLCSSELIPNWNGVANAANFQLGAPLHSVEKEHLNHIPYELSDIRLYRRSLSSSELKTISAQSEINLHPTKKIILGTFNANHKDHNEYSGLSKTQARYQRTLQRIALYHGVDPVPQNGLLLWLDAQYDVSANRKGQVSAWDNQVPTKLFSAFQTNLLQKPVLTPNAPNQKPVIHFDSKQCQYLELPEDLMKGAKQAELVILLRTAPERQTDQANAAPFSFSPYYSYGSYNDSRYPDKDGHIYDNFGHRDRPHDCDTGSTSQDLNRFHLYNVIVSKNEWTSRINGFVHCTKSQSYDSSFSDKASYYIGLNGLDSSTQTFFSGDIAGILVYDHALSDAERFSIGTYLNDEYGFISSAPPVPTLSQATAISPTQVSIIWQTAMVDNSSTTYVVERKGSNESDFKIITQQADIGSFVDNNLQPGESYNYRICAINYAGKSNYTNVLNVTLPKVDSSAALPFNGLRLWLSADNGIGADGPRVWSNRASNALYATKKVPSNEPIKLSNILNNRPVVHFDGSKHQWLELPKDLMKGAKGSEMFIVMRTSSDRKMDQVNAAPFSFSTSSYYGSCNDSRYPGEDGHIYDNFGYEDHSPSRDTGKPKQDLDQFHLYNISVQKGAWTSRINGLVHYTSSKNSDSSFADGATYYLGVNGLDDQSHTYFSGDIAEIFLYDHALANEERIAISTYLNNKYRFIEKLPSPPIDIQAEVLSSTQLNLYWHDVLDCNDFIGYRIERQGPNDSNFVPLGTHWDRNNFVDSNVVPEATYLYRICATNFAGDSEYSQPISITTPKQKLESDSLPLDHLRLWLSSNYFLNRSTGETVNKWKDYSGLNHSASTQKQETLQPTILKEGINGHPALRFEGQFGQMLDLPSNLMSKANEAEMIIVWHKATNVALGKKNGAISFGLSSSLDGSYYPDEDGHIYNGLGCSQAHDRGTSKQDLTHYHIYDAIAKTGQWRHWLNGILEYSSKDQGQTNFSETGTYNLGFSSDTSLKTFFSGDIAEIMVFDCALNEQQRAQLNDYLARKYMPPDYDPFGDGLTIEQRQALGLDPFVWDNNGDGISDGLSIKMGIDPLAANPWFKPDSLPTSPDDHTPPIITIVSPRGVLAPIASTKSSSSH